MTLSIILTTIYRYLRRLRPEDDLPITLVGAKCDKEDERVIEYMEGRVVAGNLRCSFMETSSAWNHNCSDVFVQVGVLIVTQSVIMLPKYLLNFFADN